MTGPKTAFATSGGVRKQKRDLSLKDAQDAAVLEALLSTEDGRRWFMWLLQEVCGLTATVANAAFDPHGLHFREGARNVGLTLHQQALRLAKAPYMVAVRDHLR